MSYIDDLIKECCPDGVEWKELGEVCEFKRGQSLTSKKAVAGDVPVISGGQKPAFMHNTPNREGETIVVAGSGAYAGFVSYWDKPIFVSDAFSVDIKNLHEVSVRYVFHFLLNNQQKIYATKSGAGIPHVYGKNIAKFLIPIPPLEIQEEIVKILDKFTEYVTELTSELTLRQKQYSFYRDKLLSFEDEVYQVEWKTLGEVAKDFGRGKSKHRPRNDNRLYGGDIPFVQTGDVRNSRGHITSYSQTYSDFGLKQSKLWPKGTLCITIAANIAEMGILDFDACFPDSVVGFVANENLAITKYVAYYLASIKDVLASKSTGSAQENLNLSSFSNLKIPIPSLDTQSRIVQVLDNFDTVCNDLNIGLPKEIELRQKQYEYFRDKLLTFTAEGVYTDSTVQYRQDLIRLLNWVFGPIRVQLGAICDFTRGNGLQKKDFTEEGFPVIHYGQIYTRYGFSTKDTVSFTSQSVFDKLKKAQPNDIIMATTSENVEDVGKSVVWEGDEEIGISGDAYILHTSQDARFINYYLKSIHFQTQKEKKVTGTKVIRINSNDMQNFTIIIPSIENQSRIVSILDRFDNLVNSISNGLPKEIALRQKQYEYFRDKLLSFDRNKIF
ncbi:restriction endonuclease subunit S [Streptococcus macedonicus]|uniref:restriction endonuclease subunit S n=1 Tax=Streptococcus macedonicus TaxID=59310 RepID=UPI001897CDBA|nr:restriction endonuclease subunit S [Streptococcus macedonicus]MBF6977143.1 restriction endonuclease subunit S [Streptococcus macedonicus]